MRNMPPQSPVDPVELTLDSKFQFSCHEGVACFNACCKSIDITLLPYDILRLKRRLGLSSKEFVAQYTLPYEMDFHGMPGLKMAKKPRTSECVFLAEEGCTVYEDRPSACRYYALGSMGVRPKDTNMVEDIFFVVKEAHCLGHNEPHTQTVGEYRKTQGIEKYDDMNREWRDLVIKKRSTGPTVGAPSERSMQLFDMCSYDMDSFREFIQTDGFKGVFDIDANQYAELRDDENRLYAFSIRFLKQVLFGEMSIPIKPDAARKRVQERKDLWEKRRAEEVQKYREDLEKQKYE